MIEKVSTFDAAEFLDSPEKRAEFLAVALEDYDATHFRNALSIVARSQNMTEIAEDAGISRQGLYKALGDDGDPKLSTLLGIMQALGIKMTTEAA